MTMPPAEVQSAPATMSGASAALDAAPSDPRTAELEQRIDAELERSAEAAWDEASPEAQDEMERQFAVADQSLLRRPNDEIEAELTDIEEMSRIAAEAQAEIEEEERAAGTRWGTGQDAEDDAADAPTSRDAAEARRIVSQAEAELANIRASDQNVMLQLAEISGFNKEANGRTRFENLSDRVIKGVASLAEQRECTEMHEWQELARPIYRAAQVQIQQQFMNGVTAGFSAPLNAAVKAGELTPEEARTVYYADPARLAKLAIDGVRARGQSRSAPAAASTRSMTTRSAAPRAESGRVRVSSPEPLGVDPTGKASAGFLKKAFLPNGEVNPEFERMAKSGRFLGVDLSKL